MLKNKLKKCIEKCMNHSVPIDIYRKKRLTKPGGLFKMKFGTPQTIKQKSGFEPATSRFVARTITTK